MAPAAAVGVPTQTHGLRGHLVSLRRGGLRRGIIGMPCTRAMENPLFNICLYCTSAQGGYLIQDIAGTDDNVTTNKSLANIFSKQMTALVLYTPACLIAIYGEAKVSISVTI